MLIGLTTFTLIKRRELKTNLGALNICLLMILFMMRVAGFDKYTNELIYKTKNEITI